jgi:DNA-binding PadR family transcriptional regulator
VSEWKLTDKKQRAKFYRLTRAGKAQLLRERSRWEQLSDAIAAILNQAKTEGEA